MSAKQVLLLPVKALLLALILTVCFSVAAAICGLGRVRPQPRGAEVPSQGVPTASPHAAAGADKMQFHPKPGAAGPAPATAAPAPPEPAKVLRLLFAACLLQTIVLTYIIMRSSWTGWRLGGAVFVAFFGAAYLQASLESAAYLRQKFPGLGLRMLLMGAITAAVFSPLSLVILSRFSDGAESRAAPRRRIAAWNVPAIILIFLVVYYTCGYYIAWQSPFVREFYGGREPEGFVSQLAGIWSATPWMYFFQAFRGLIYLFIALPVVWMLRRKPWEIGLAVALLFSVVGSALLILPNPLMGEAVARVHLVETLVGNFVFGWFTGWLLSRGTHVVRAA